MEGKELEVFFFRTEGAILGLLSATGRFRRERGVLLCKFLDASYEV